MGIVEPGGFMSKRAVAMVLSCFFLLTLCGCLTTKKEQKYLKMVNQVPLDFVLDNENGELAWIRAQKFIAKYVSSPLKIVTPHVIQTETTHDFFQNDVYYSITRTPVKDGQRFEIQCSPMRASDAHMLAHYMQTGELPHPNLIGW